MALKEGIIRVRYTNLLLCGLPDSGRSSFLQLLRGGDVSGDDSRISRMIMRTPQLKFEDLAKHRWEWDELDYTTLRDIVTNHIKCGRHTDMPEQSSHTTDEQLSHPPSTIDEQKAQLSRDEYSFEDFLIRSLSQRVKQQCQLFELHESGNLQEAIREWKSYVSSKAPLEPKAEFHKLLLCIDTEEAIHKYIELLENVHHRLNLFKRHRFLLQKEDIFNSFEDEVSKLYVYADTDRLHWILLQFVVSSQLHVYPQQSFGFHTDSLPSIPSSSASTTPSSQPHVSPSHPSSVCNEILHALPTANFPDGKDLHFINIVESCGPLSFLNTLPAIVSYTTVNLITHRLDIRLDERYSESAFHFKDGTTHIDLLDNLIRSLSFSQKPPTEGITAHTEPEPNEKMFLVVGTCLDRIDNVELQLKNELLDKRFNKIFDTLLLDAGCFLFAVDNLKRGENEEEKLILIRRKVCKHYIEADIPIRWYLLQLELMKAQEFCDVLPLDEVLRIGETLQMSGDDVKKALSFFHDMTIIFYFSVVLHNWVFVNPSTFLAKLTTVTRKYQLHADVLPYIDVDAPAEVRKQLLERLLLVLQQEPRSHPRSISKRPHPRSDLRHHYLFPSASGSYVVDPLVISWDHKIPCGLFHALCVKLNWGFPSQCLQNFVHFRDKQVTLIAHQCHWIEIHYEGQDFDACFKIKSEIHEAIRYILALFNIDATALPQKCEYFLCFAKLHRPDHLCIIDDNESAICVQYGSIVGITERQRPWLTPYSKQRE